MILVSKCLTGEPCRYNGKGKPNQAVIDFLSNLQIGHDYLLICPECDGGLPIPRKGGEICGGSAADVLLGKAKVCNCDGDDYTAEFITGARAAVTLAQESGATAALLKEKSPSCGVHLIHNGRFDDGIIEGQGVTAYMLDTIGVHTFCEDELDNLREFCENCRAKIKNNR